MYVCKALVKILGVRLILYSSPGSSAIAHSQPSRSSPHLGLCQVSLETSPSMSCMAQPICLSVVCCVVFIARLHPLGSASAGSARGMKRRSAERRQRKAPTARSNSPRLFLRPELHGSFALVSSTQSPTFHLPDCSCPHDHTKRVRVCPRPHRLKAPADHEKTN